MITALIIIALAFTWLLDETDWLRIRLPYGGCKSLVSNPVIKQPDRKWQFLKCGDGSLMLCQNCNYKSRRSCGKAQERWFAWKLPAQTVKVYGSTINFKAGCNQHRAKLLKDIVKAQKSKAVPTYKKALLPASCYPALPDASIELLVDGKSIANINGDYKRGDIKQALKPYTARVKL